MSVRRGHRRRGGRSRVKKARSRRSSPPGPIVPTLFPSTVTLGLALGDDEEPRAARALLEDDIAGSDLPFRASWPRSGRVPSRPAPRRAGRSSASPPSRRPRRSYITPHAATTFRPGCTCEGRRHRLLARLAQCRRRAVRLPHRGRREPFSSTAGPGRPCSSAQRQRRLARGGRDRESRTSTSTTGAISFRGRSAPRFGPGRRATKPDLWLPPGGEERLRSFGGEGSRSRISSARCSPCVSTPRKTPSPPPGSR